MRCVLFVWNRNDLRPLDLELQVVTFSLAQTSEDKSDFLRLASGSALVQLLLLVESSVRLATGLLSQICMCPVQSSMIILRVYALEAAHQTSLTKLKMS